MNRKQRRQMKVVRDQGLDVITASFHRPVLEFLYQQTGRMVGSDSQASRIIASVQEELEHALGISLPPVLSMAESETEEIEEDSDA